MLIPNAQLAIIAREKIRDYLLDVGHPWGGSKARLLVSLGYTVQDWMRLEVDLRQQHLTAEVDRTSQTVYGMRYEILAPLRTPSGRAVVFRSIWQIDTGTAVPRFITMYPE